MEKRKKNLIKHGKFNVHSRDEIKDIITLNGGQIVSSWNQDQLRPLSH